MRLSRGVSVAGNFFVVLIIVLEELPALRVGPSETLYEIVVLASRRKFLGQMVDIEGLIMRHIDFCALLEPISRSWILSGDRKFVQTGDEVGYIDQTLFERSI
jgi:hypothetical protein